jgi:hypothetical protein
MGIYVHLKNKTGSDQVHIKAGIGSAVWIEYVPIRYVLYAIANFNFVVNTVINAHIRTPASLHPDSADRLETGEMLPIKAISTIPMKIFHTLNSSDTKLIILSPCLPESVFSKG